VQPPAPTPPVAREVESKTIIKTTRP
jgi:hypothetical protein